MKEFLTLPESELGICVVTPAANSALALRNVKPSTLFDAHRSSIPFENMADWEKLKRFSQIRGDQPLTSNFRVHASLFDRYPEVMRVETWLSRNTTILKLKSETI